MEFPSARILVFAKAPVPGQVKTRLAGRYGAIGAAQLYQTLLREVLGTATEARLCPVELWCAPDTRHGFFAACRRDYGVSLRAQRAGDLGQRMRRAFAMTLAEHDHALIIGADCAALSGAELRQALHVLAAGADAVLGPALDGGYVLIGLRRPCAALFAGITWSSASVLPATRRRLQRAGLRWRELEPSWDVDQPADVRRWRALRTLRSNSAR